jgi:[acyl-carrier-protein] S-malonyltransferase
MSLIDFSSLPEGTDAWLFPGQGAQQLGMSLDFAEDDPEVAALFSQADEVLGFSLSDLIGSGAEAELVRTVNTQPAVFVASLAALKATARHSRALRLSQPLFVAGHSLGEYSAVVAAGSLSFIDGLRLVQERARLMQAASEKRPGTLAALLGADLDQAQALCEATGCEVCNINAPGQIVIGGTVEMVTAAADAARDYGIKRVMPLNVGGAFHTSLMSSAAEGLSSYLAGVAFEEPEVPVVANGSAEPLAGSEQLRAELTFQLDHPVRWEEGIRCMTAGGVTRFIEFGPGSVLTGMVKRIAPEAQTVNVSSLADLASPVAP